MGDGGGIAFDDRIHGFLAKRCIKIPAVIFHTMTLFIWRRLTDVKKHV